MKVVVFGGAGRMGRLAVQDLAASAQAGEIIIADKSKEKAETLVRELEDTGTKVTAIEIDVNKSDELSRILKGADLALGMIGPFYTFEERLAGASIHAGVDYLSICDDYEATQKVFSMDGPARKAGVRLVTGLGMTPGMTNILSRHGYERMERVKKINIAWSAPAYGEVSEAVVEHTLNCFSGMIPTFLNGRETFVKAGSGKDLRVFPEPIGLSKVWHVGHPEPVTIPRYLKGLEEVTLRGGIFPYWMSGFIKTCARFNLFENKRGMDFWRSLPNPFRVFHRKQRKKEVILGIRIDMVGESEEKETHFAYGCVEPMSRATGLSMAVGTMLFIKNSDQIKPGVMAPETVYDPGIFLKELLKRNIRIFQGDQMTEEIEL